MPRRLTHIKPGTAQVLKNVSYESLVVSWLMQDKWQVFMPILDNSHQTDIIVSDGPNFHRIQIKTIMAKKPSQLIENQWLNSNVDYIVIFARNSNWGYVIPAFSEKRKRLNAAGHCKFIQTRTQFLKAFHIV